MNTDGFGMQTVAVHDDGPVGFGHVPDGFAVAGDGTTDDRIPFHNTLCGSIGRCTCLAWMLNFHDRWAQLTRDYYVYKAMTQNPALTKQAALRAYTMEMNKVGGADVVKRQVYATQLQSGHAAGLVEMSTDTWRTLRNPLRNRLVVVDTIEDIEAW